MDDVANALGPITKRVLPDQKWCPFPHYNAKGERSVEFRLIYHDRTPAQIPDDTYDTLAIALHSLGFNVDQKPGEVRLVPEDDSVASFLRFVRFTKTPKDRADSQMERPVLVVDTPSRKPGSPQASSVERLRAGLRNLQGHLIRVGPAIGRQFEEAERDLRETRQFFRVLSRLDTRNGGPSS